MHLFSQIAIVFFQSVNCIPWANLCTLLSSDILKAIKWPCTLCGLWLFHFFKLPWIRFSSGFLCFVHLFGPWFGFSCIVPIFLEELILLCLYEIFFLSCYAVYIAWSLSICIFAIFVLSSFLQLHQIVSKLRFIGLWQLLG